MRYAWLSIVMLLLVSAKTTRAEEGPPLRLARTIPLPNVEGRIDHLAVDLKGQRLFVAALGNNTVEVLDLKQGKHLHRITGLQEPQGIAYILESNRIVVASGGDGSMPVAEVLKNPPPTPVEAAAPRKKP